MLGCKNIEKCTAAFPAKVPRTISSNISSLKMQRFKINLYFQDIPTLTIFWWVPGCKNKLINKKIYLGLVFS